MEYLANIGSITTKQIRRSVSCGVLQASSIATKVLETNRVLESFGNARTVRNDNSSRFGKFIKLHFQGSGGKLVGASIQTYLLEKVRLVSQSKDERNYHIFYELCCGANAAERENWKLLKDLESYRYMNQSGCMTRKDNTNDASSYTRTVQAMKDIGFTDDEREFIFKLLSGILHLGNLEFETSRNSFSASSKHAKGESQRPQLTYACQESFQSASILLDLEPTDLEEKLCTRKIKAGAEFLFVFLTTDQATQAQDALAKTIYSKIFSWLIQRINSFLQCNIRTTSNTINDDFKSSQFIGILDIFGFEIFPVNSFEQLCINFANETLQQQFNQYIFKLEQADYEKEDIDWSYIEFPDNQDIVDLISKRHIGILSLIDEECLIPRATDSSFASKLYQRWESHEKFAATRIQVAAGTFTIQHYAGPVCYSSAGFLEKNKDQLHQEVLDLLNTSRNPFIQTICTISNTSVHDVKPSSKFRKIKPGKNREGSAIATTSVGSQFKLQLVELLATIEQTSPHYIRCLKPNDMAKPDVFNAERVLQQLRCSGVVEAIRVSRAGFPIRILNDDFVFRFRVLLQEENPECSVHDIVRATLPLIRDKLKLPESNTEDSIKLQCAKTGIQLGTTKLFFKQNAFDALEEFRVGKVRKYQEKIHYFTLTNFKRLHYNRMRTSVICLQYCLRSKVKKRKATRQIEVQKRLVTAVILQSLVRGYLQRIKYSQQIKTKREKDVAIAQEKQRELDERLQEQARLQEKALESKKKKERMIAAQKATLEMQKAALTQTNNEKPSTSNLSISSPHTPDSSVWESEFDEETKSSMPSTPTVSSKASKKAPPRVKSLQTSENESSSWRSFSGFESPRYHNPVMNAQSLTSARDVAQPLRATIADQSKSLTSEPIRMSRVVNLPKLGTASLASWVNDEDRFSCHVCNKRFNVFRRKHHCRACGEIICKACSLYHQIDKAPMRVCVSCVAFHSVASPVNMRATNKNLMSTDSPSSMGTAENEEYWLNPWPAPPIPENEADRLQQLRQMDVRQMKEGGWFDMYCDVAARSFHCPIAAVSVIEEDEQILLANMGMSQEIFPRELSLDAHAICESTPLVVLDTKRDPRFRENPMVKGAVKIRFYVGVPILSPNGAAVGTICVYDTKSRRSVDPEKVQILQNLSLIIATAMAKSLQSDEV